MKKRFNESSIGLGVAVVAAFTGLASACGSKSSSSGSGTSSTSSTAAAKSGGESGGSKGKAATCAFQKDPNNCWRKFVDSVKTCLGDADPGDGKLADDNKSCTHKGRTVTFAKPPVAPEKAKKDIDFTVKAGDKECLHWTETGQGLDMDATDMKIDFTMTGTSLFGKVVVHRGTMDWSITCPDGNEWVSSLEMAMTSKDMADCSEADSMSPNSIALFTPGLASFELGIQTLDLKALKIFECMKAG